MHSICLTGGQGKDALIASNLKNQRLVRYVDGIFSEAENELAGVKLKVAVDAGERSGEPLPKRHVFHNPAHGIVVEIETRCGAVKEESGVGLPEGEGWSKGSVTKLVGHGINMDPIAVGDRVS